MSAIGFAVSEEFHIDHLLNPTAVEVNYRTEKYESMAPVWYWREDFESAARYADAQVETHSDSRLLVFNAPPASRYIDRPHAVYYSRAHGRFANVSRQSGTIDLWSNQQLLSTPEEFQAYARQARSIWVVRSLVSEQHDITWGELLGDLPYVARLAHESDDHRIRVTELILNVGAN